MKKINIQKRFKTPLIFILLVFLIILSVGGYYINRKNLQNKINQQFEDKYLEIKSYDSDLIIGLGLESTCATDEKDKLFAKINDYNRASNINEVNSTVERFTRCSMESTISVNNKENKAISNINGMVVKLKTDEQKKYADELVKICRDIFNTKEEYFKIISEYNSKERNYASTKASYISGNTSVLTLNKATDELNQAYKAMKEENQSEKWHKLETQRDDAWGRLKILLSKK